MRKAAKQEIRGAAAFLFLQRKHVLSYAQLLSITKQDTCMYMKKPFLDTFGPFFFIFRCVPILTFTMVVILYETKNDVFFNSGQLAPS